MMQMQMDTITVTKRSLIAVIVLISFCLARPAAAQYYSNAKWSSAFRVGRILTDAAPVPIVDRQPATTMSIDDGISAAYDLSREVKSWLEIQAGLGIISFPAEAGVTQRSTDNLVTEHRVSFDRLWLTEYHLAALYRFPRFGIFNTYAGPILSGVARDVAMATGTDATVAPITVSSTVGAGAQFGVLLTCACEGLAFDFNLRRSLYRPLVTGGARAAINPWFISAGT